jgi:hypothetical protein
MSLGMFEKMRRMVSEKQHLQQMKRIDYAIKAANEAEKEEMLLRQELKAREKVESVQRLREKAKSKRGGTLKAVGQRFKSMQKAAEANTQSRNMMFSGKDQFGSSNKEPFSFGSGSPFSGTTKKIERKVRCGKTIVIKV